MHEDAFDRWIDRRGTASIKWDAYPRYFNLTEEKAQDILPMWVADMDFPAPTSVLEVLRSRLDHGILGYSTADVQLKDSVRYWLKKRHGWDVKDDAILFSPGVVPSMGLSILALTEPGDGVLIFPPVYKPFYTVVETSGRKLLKSPLKLEEGSGGTMRYVLDPLHLETVLHNEQPRLILLCSPHNPTGRVFTEAELTALLELAMRYKIAIVSDEIHADLVFPPHKHIPLGRHPLAQKTPVLTLMAPTKTFNLAGLQGSMIIVEDSEIRDKLANSLLRFGLNHLNTFAQLAMTEAYRNGEAWLDQVLHYLRENMRYVQKTLSDALPMAKIFMPEGTYLMWIDLRAYAQSEGELREKIIERGKLLVNFGSDYGPEGEGYIRLNVAAPRSTVEEGVRRMVQALSPSWA